MFNADIDIQDLTYKLRQAVRSSSNEEELRIRVAKHIEDLILKPLDIPYSKYEHRLFISGARIDALYGHVIVEFKAPGKLSTDSEIAKAKEQLIRYIIEESRNSYKERYLGVIISDRIAFVRYDWRNDTWLLRGPYDINEQSVIKLVEAIRGLRRKNLNVDNLIKDFGPKAEITKRLVKELYNKLYSHINNNVRIKMLFDDWYRLFTHATGYNINKLKGLEKEYELDTNINLEYLLFSIHTYYSLLIKLIAAEIVYEYSSGRILRSYISELDHNYMNEGINGLRKTLENLESGFIFKNMMNIVNFLEGDYFSWYLYVIDKSLADNIAELVRRLNDYEIATPQLEPEFAMDLLKRLYQYLMPREIRYSLGEYYTPDWLAEYLLKEVGLTTDRFESNTSNRYQPLELRVLDPACGSGTFIIAYIKQLRKYAEEHHILDLLPNYILKNKNVVGYDLNPIAVLTAKTNYLLLIGDLLRDVKGEIEIPIYLTDSLQIGRETSVQGSVYKIKTTVEEFEFLTDIVDDEKLLTNILREIEICLNNRYSVEEFVDRIKDKNLDDKYIYNLKEIYSKFLKLEKENKNGIWLAILRNSLAPLRQGKFDYVIGNPPWVNWENIASDYKDRIKSLYKEYEILPKNTNAATKIDISMLFVYRCVDKYLKDEGYLAFLINDAAFKAMAGNGFRRFRFKKGEEVKYFELLKVYDLVDINPFEATNRTAMFIVKKNNKETQYPIPYIRWKKSNPNTIRTDMTLDEVKKLITIEELYAEPLKKEDEVYPLTTLDKKTIRLRNLIGNSYYKAHAGAGLSPSNIFRIKIIGKRNDGMLIIKNLTKGKIEAEETEVPIEEDFVYPILESKDVKRWHFKYDTYAIIAHDKDTLNPIGIDKLKKYPYTFKYLSKFEAKLKDRAHYKAYGRDKPYYFVYCFANYTLTPYKVAWNRMGNQLNAAVITPINDDYLGSKPLIPEHVIAFIPLERPKNISIESHKSDNNIEDEAHYICAILNSTPVNILLQSIAKGGKNFATPNFINMINIKKYDPTNSLHKRLAELSKNAHKAKQNNNVEELKNIEKEIDNIVKDLYNIDIDEREDDSSINIEDQQQPSYPSVNVLNTVLQPSKNGNIELYVTNPTGKEFRIELVFPWSNQTINVKEGSYIINIPPLQEGSYKAKLRWYFNDNIHEEEFTIDVRSNIPKRKYKW